jgi:hypothetical protein
MIHVVHGTQHAADVWTACKTVLQDCYSAAAQQQAPMTFAQGTSQQGLINTEQTARAPSGYTER